ncbi:MAG: hypothetical protein ABI888_03075 [Chloroflexota bacterium]
MSSREDTRDAASGGMRRSLLCVVAAVVISCTTATPAPTSTSAPTATPTTAKDPRAAVTLLLPGSAASPCSGTQPDQLYRRARGCPITDRLEQRLHVAAVQGFNPICRCQSSVQAEVGAASVSGTSATVPVTFRAPNAFVITLAVVLEGSDWHVDDSWCADDKTTTIYATTVASCGG